MDIEEFIETAKVYACNESVWLVNHDLAIATHCSDTTFNRQDWGAVYTPTNAKYLEFLEDDRWN